MLMPLQVESPSYETLRGPERIRSTSLDLRALVDLIVIDLGY